MNIDSGVSSWAASIQTGSFTIVAKGIDIAFDTFALLVLTLVTAAILFILRHWKGSLLLGGAMAGDAVLVLVFKALIQSPRPMNELIPATGFSFPSGHVTGSVVFFGVLTYLTWRHRASAKTKAATGTGYVALTVLVGFDRIYLNVHWFSDVVGAAFLGALWIAFSIFMFEYLTSYRKKQLSDAKVGKVPS